MFIIKKYNIFKESFTEFNLQRMNPDMGGMMPNVDNPQLSINAFDKHENAIRAATDKLNSLLNTLSNSSHFAVLKSKLALEDQNIESIKILRIVKSDIRYDFYISFFIKDEEYWGVIKDMLGLHPKFESEVFKDTDLILSKEWVIKIKGLVIKLIKKWLTIENGKYRYINPENCSCFNVKTGNIERLIKDTEVEVVRSYDNKILIKHEDDYFHLTGDSYVYFNYWFIKDL